MNVPLNGDEKHYNVNIIHKHLILHNYHLNKINLYKADSLFYEDYDKVDLNMDFNTQIQWSNDQTVRNMQT